MASCHASKSRYPEVLPTPQPTLHPRRRWRGRRIWDASSGTKYLGRSIWDAV